MRGTDALDERSGAVKRMRLSRFDDRSGPSINQVRLWDLVWATQAWDVDGMDLGDEEWMDLSRRIAYEYQEGLALDLSEPLGRLMVADDEA